MDRMIFVNLPVSDLERATSFYLGLGFTKNDMFSDEKATSIIVAENIFVMLLVESYFDTFLPGDDKPLLGSTSKETLNALSAASNDEVDAFVANAEANGGAVYRPVSDQGFMYSAAITDPDGHVWEIVYMPMPENGGE